MSFKTNLDLIFGQPEADTAYIHRPGAYAVMLNDEGLLALVEVDGLLFLPGGGCEEDESLQACLKREILEETGQGAHILWTIGEAGEYIFTGSGRQRHYFKTGTFFLAEFVKTPLIARGEHPLHWLPPEEALSQLSHKSQVWAVKRVLKLMGK